MMTSSSTIIHASAQEQPVHGEGSGSALFGRRSDDQVDTRMPVVAMKEEHEECALGHGEGGDRGRGRREEQTDCDLIFGGPRRAQAEDTKVEGSPLADHAAGSNRSLLQASFQPDPSQMIKRPTWLANAVLRLQTQQASAAGNGTGESHMGSDGGQENGSYGAHWLSMPLAHYENGNNDGTSPPQGGSLMQPGFKNASMYNGSSLRTQYDSGENGYRQGQGGDENGDGDNNSEPNHDTEDQENWVLARRKADIVSHPLFPELLSAHVACLRIATPVDQLGTIDAQLSQSHHVINKYQALSLDSRPEDNPDKEELEQYMADNVMLLRSFKDQLQQHVRVHAMEAVMSCYDLEKQLEELTGVRVGESGQTSGCLMSDDEDEAHGDSDLSAYDPSLDGAENGGFGPLIPTETERTLMERVRQELKAELKQGYKAKIIDVREEILRKRRAGKLPGDTTTVLKTWWHAHAKWPYPTEDEKARLVQETGLELKQINNWFINQRKRNWHANPSAAAAAKTKRKR